jgi:ligand-binding sensor domain-containing protein
MFRQMAGLLTVVSILVALELQPCALAFAHASGAQIVGGFPVASAAPTPPADALGPEQLNEEGGYAFRPVNGYEMDTSGRDVFMAAPDADPETGPIIMLGASQVEGTRTLEDAYDKLMEDFDGVVRGKPREISVDGAPGWVVDVSGPQAGKELVGRLVLAKPDAERGFYMLGGAPAERWESEVEGLFEAVLASVRLLGPEVVATAVPTPVVKLTLALPTKTPAKPTKTVEMDVLGPEQRNEEAGYAFRPIAGYEMEQSGDNFSMLAPGADPSTGPLFFLGTSAVEGTRTLEEAYQQVVTDFEGATLSERREITVDGAPGFEMDISRSENGDEVLGRLVITKPDAEHGFFILGGAPAKIWKSEVEALFEAVLASVKLLGPRAAATAVPTPVVKPTKAVQADMLGPEQSNEEGGYAFRPVVGYELETAGRDVYMIAPDADSSSGPMLVLGASEIEGTTTLQEAYDKLTADIGKEATLGKPRKTTVDDTPALIVDISGTMDGSEMLGRLVVAKSDAERGFYMLGAAPAQRWQSEVEGLFEAVLASVRLLGPEAAATAMPTPTVVTGKPTKAAQVDALGPEQRNEEGGFAFRPVAGYESETFGRDVYMLAPDADPDTGPMFLLGSSEVEGIRTLQEAYDELTADIGEETTLGEPRKTSVDDAPALVVDVSGSQDGKEMLGRLVVAKPDAERGFYMLGAASAERWESEVEVLFEAVLASVNLFEPVVVVPTIAPPPPTQTPTPTRASIPAGVKAHPNWTSYTYGDDVQKLAIDGKGRVWAVGSGGAVHWNPKDGSHVKYTVDDGLPRNPVFSVAVADDAVWFGTGSGATRFDGRTWTTLTYEDGLADNYLVDIAVTSNGAMWFATWGGISHFDGKEWRKYTTDDGLVDANLQCLAAAPDGSLWAGTSGGVSHFDGETWTSYTTEDGLVSDAVQTIAVAQDGVVWFGTSDGASRFDGKQWKTYTEEDGLGYGNVSAIAIARDGAAWFGTTWGVSRFDGKTWTAYTMSDGLVGDTVSSIVADADDAIWIGTSQGVSRFDGKTWRSYVTGDPLRSNEIQAAAVADDGTLWFGTWNGGVSHYDGQTWTTYSYEDGLNMSYVNAVAVADDGTLWAGGYGLSRFDGKNWTRYTSEEGLVGDDAGALAFAPDGALWIGSRYNGVLRFDGKSWKTYTSEDGLASDEVLSIAVASDGVLWVGTNGAGVSRFDGKQWKTYTSEDGLGGDDIQAIGVAPDGALWFAAWGGTVSRFDGKEWTTWDYEHGLTGDTIYGFAFASDGVVWCGTGGGVSRFDGESWTHYGVGDGLGHSWVQAIALAPDGALWLGTFGGGISRFVPVR